MSPFAAPLSIPMARMPAAKTSSSARTVFVVDVRGHGVSHLHEGRGKPDVPVRHAADGDLSPVHDGVEAELRSLHELLDDHARGPGKRQRGTARISQLRRRFPRASLPARPCCPRASRRAGNAFPASRAARGSPSPFQVTKQGLGTPAAAKASRMRHLSVALIAVANGMPGRPSFSATHATEEEKSVPAVKTPSRPDPSRALNARRQEARHGPSGRCTRTGPPCRARAPRGCRRRGSPASPCAVQCERRAPA